METDYKICALPNKQKCKVKPSPNCEMIPKHPARVAFSGSSGSGKTNAMLQLLLGKNFYKGYFELIFVFSPTAMIDDVWQNVIPKIIKKQHVFDTPNEEVIDQIFEKQSEIVRDNGIHKAPRILIILDDIIDNKIVMKSKALAKLMYRGRHIGISVWVSTQSYNKVPRSLRLQLTNLILFKPTRSEMDVICKNICPAHLNHREFESLITHATKEPYNFCHICFEMNQDKMVRKNFDKILNYKK